MNEVPVWFSVHSLRLGVDEWVGNYHSPFPPYQVTPCIRAVTELLIDPLFVFCFLFFFKFVLHFSGNWQWSKGSWPEGVDP